VLSSQLEIKVSKDDKENSCIIISGLKNENIFNSFVCSIEMDKKMRVRKRCNERCRVDLILYHFVIRNSRD